jgi:hypothetical protein
MTAQMRCFIQRDTQMWKAPARRSERVAREFRDTAASHAAEQSIQGSRTMKSSGLEPADRLASASRLSQIWLFAVSDGVPLRSLVVALTVGTILNLINQGDALVGEGRVNLTKIILTFAVPYCVATYGAVSYRMSGAGASRRSPAGVQRGRSA